MLVFQGVCPEFVWFLLVVVDIFKLFGSPKIMLEKNPKKSGIHS